MAILPGVWAPWEWTALSQPWWEVERRIPCCFFPRTLVDDLSSTYMLHESLCPPESSDEGTQDQRWSVFLGRMYIFLMNF